MEEKKKKPIDFTAIFKTLQPHKKTYFRVLPAVLVGTYLFMLFIPRYYECKVSLAPESGDASLSGSIGSLASSFGLGSSLAKMNSDDAIFSEIYPEVIKSKNFIADLMPIEVTTQDGTIRCNYYTYLRDKQKAPFWSNLITAIKQKISPPKADSCTGEQPIEVMHLTKLQNNLFTAVQGKIKCTVDKKTSVVYITIQDQDPLVCATMADATCLKLQEFIVKYRTHKAQIDYDYYKGLCEEARADYENALHAYAAYSDSHMHTVLSSYQSKLESLENDMQAKLTMYNAMNTQMLGARAKLQESTPAFTVIESASVTVKPAGPKRMITAIFMAILAFFALSAWWLIKAEKAKAPTVEA